MSPEQRQSGAAPHLVLWLMVGLVSACIAWALIGRLDVVATAQGEVVPSTQVKSVQHLEGGIVRAILVREGQRVGAGEPLIELDPVRSDADVAQLTVQLTNLKIEIARLEAESAGAGRISFPGGIAEAYPEQTSRARELFASRRARIENRIESQNERISQRRDEIKAIEGRIASNKGRLKLVREQIKISEGLMEDQLSNRMNHLDLLKEEAALAARVRDDQAALPRARSAAKEAEADREEIDAEYLEGVREALSKAKGDAGETAARLRKFEDALKRTVLRSPVAGVIKTLHVATIGGVVQPGHPVVDVVPQGDKLVIEARLPTRDVGYVQTGQPVQVSLASSEAIRFGRIVGEVVNVSPDTIETRDGIPYYKVRVETDQTYFKSAQLRYALLPGVQVACAIRTGQRSVMAYILDPFLTSIQTALRER
ncbi:HlyD family type I secretion periplasmic adaptor subunit [Thalassospiraceae bacterium LMO-JJ14]|nr:HlyD family type I secretion periplasmic adaptor subunit [Thalassospiraceae bacterium LMO-JJ14]